METLKYILESLKLDDSFLLGLVLGVILGEVLISLLL
nr:MAG TPA: Protein of unknown function (DUF3789) [Caudoviricetes sp.]DAY30626.1 MAG TPA: Protein of unknown function (DUF3789) [Bacteriophage sp.]